MRKINLLRLFVNYAITPLFWDCEKREGKKFGKIGKKDLNAKSKTVHFETV